MIMDYYIHCTAILYNVSASRAYMMLLMLKATLAIAV